MLPGRLFDPARKRLRRILGITALISALVASAAWVPATSAGTPSPTPMTTQEWHSTMVRIATPAKGCFTAAYPTLAWRAVACAEGSNRPYPPQSGTSGPGTGPGTGFAGPGPAIVGNGIDFSAGVTGVMTGATGSFPSVSGVTSETGIGGANSYSLQLNTKPFATPACAGQPLCLGWEQFIYSTSGYAFIQFWLLQFTGPCPAGWTPSLGIYCYRNGNFVGMALQPITNLANMSVTGTVTGGVGGMDTVSVSTTGPAGPMLSAATSDSTLNLSADWAAVEFAVVGDGNGSQAVFNPGSTIVVQTVTHNGTTAAPTCLYQGYTGETNNLNLVGTPTLAVGASPAIRSTQSNVLGTAPSCASASGNGDTHMRTFDGLYFDNQARGDLQEVLAPGFSVQSRQVSGAPNWPNAAVNSGVATQMGPDRVALCLPNRLVIDGAATTLAAGQKIALSSGDTVLRTGNVYVVTDPSGDSMRATMNGAYINLTVGLGAYPSSVTGLMANAPGNVNQVVTRSGAVLNTPLDFQTFYNTYVQSWRVPPSDSLLSDCGGQVDSSLPSAPFWANNLQKNVHDQAQAVCQANRVNDATLLDACTLDVAVLGEGAAGAYVGQAPPVAVGFK